ncbi:Gfo/Idh/MocA family protein [Lactococcus termiticola]|uniref:NAD(P)-dependent oxidoreductase n=1 Tax=Lactococcus termiticola TaxID=2169526 RepID=A0A2R5HK67_9LACT|nr:Gfo/Idh/MocA family oxidoreductase [Lactococcus termiticola]GBG97148.1 NAD(P)-dependent oxidoreductase [Lactococcus termiticola]
MLKLGVIGTGWISSSFVEAALLTKQYDIDAVYSRTLAGAVSFTEDWDHVAVYNELGEFFQHDLDVIYIASPNSLHFEHAKLAIEAGHNVIVEKPAFSNPKELAEIIALAESKGKLFFEAARNIHEDAYKKIKDFLADKEVIGADFTYSKYSSKMPALLEGKKLPNKFNKAFSGGLLADLGVYMLYGSVYWFGKPDSAYYNAVVLPSGVDLSGVGCLDYGNYKVAVKNAGNFNSYLPSEIYTTTGTLVLDAISEIKSAKFIDLEGNEEKLVCKPAKHNLYDEAVDFAGILNDPAGQQAAYQELMDYALAVAETSYKMRERAGIVYDAD